MAAAGGHRSTPDEDTVGLREQRQDSPITLLSLGLQTLRLLSVLLWGRSEDNPGSSKHSVLFPWQYKFILLRSVFWQIRQRCSPSVFARRSPGRIAL